MREKLKEIRLSKNLSVQEVATNLEISASHYYKIEAGIRSPNFKLAGRFAKFFDSNVDELFFEDDLDETSKKKTG